MCGVVKLVKNRQKTDRWTKEGQCDTPCPCMCPVSIPRADAICRDGAKHRRWAERTHANAHRNDQPSVKFGNKAAVSFVSGRCRYRPQPSHQSTHSERDERDAKLEK